MRSSSSLSLPPSLCLSLLSAFPAKPKRGMFGRRRGTPSDWPIVEKAEEMQIERGNGLHSNLSSKQKYPKMIYDLITCADQSHFPLIFLTSSVRLDVSLLQTCFLWRIDRSIEETPSDSNSARDLCGPDDYPSARPMS